ncbi:MAG: U32 family peptidase [Oceanospirillaceae bacterium]|nr:U32 family peptidase [Oceanospirillaceae bacterium]MCP5350687.1 U32 family peptidase [Oceanospirillaceae bacterium]
MELVCPAGSVNAFKAAVEQGADAIYIGFNDSTNARNFSGLNFNDSRARWALDMAREKGVKLYVAINTYAQAAKFQQWQQAVDQAAALGAHAVIMADIGLLAYAAQRYPQMQRHLSVQASATSAQALAFYQQHTGIRRAVIPRVLSLAQIQALCAQSSVGIEVFGFGSLCIMAEGRCHMSSYVTGESPNMQGVCSPAKFVHWQENADGSMHSRLNGELIDYFAPGENAGYPTLCKGRFAVEDDTYHAFEAPTSLNTLELLPELQAAGVQAIKIEGRQRSPAYVASVVSVWRKAIDSLQHNPQQFNVLPAWQNKLSELSEGAQTTFGAYHRSWQ